MPENYDGGGGWGSRLWTVVVVIVIVAGVEYAFDHNPRTESAGWVSHNVQTTITVQPTWLVGESKNCTSYPLNAEAAQAQGKQPGYAFSGVECDDGPKHNIAITFQGAENQPTKMMAFWNCTRNSDSFTCKQTGAD